MARTIGSKNKPKTPFPVKAVDKKINDVYTKKEVDRLKNLVARQDDLIAQMLDELKQEQNKTGKLGQELEDLEDEIDSWKEIVKTIMEVV